MKLSIKAKKLLKYIQSKYRPNIPDGIFNYHIKLGEYPYLTSEEHIKAAKELMNEKLIFAFNPGQNGLYQISPLGIELIKNQNILTNQKLDKPELQIGDIVQLRSGGPDMTIEKIDLINNTVQCVRFTENHIFRDSFIIQTLSKVG